MAARDVAYAVVVAGTASVLVLSAQADSRAVIELFTSQGCSSCPPADKLVGEFASDPAFVPISVPIDYWDYLGWKDTLADPRHTARQRAYAKMRGDREVYTPQVVVNGSLHALGSDRRAIERAIEQSRHIPAVQSLPVKLAVSDGRVTVGVPSGVAHADAEVWISGLARAVNIAIKRGENTGKTITYHNVARSWLKLGMWTGAANTWTFPVKDIARDGIDAAAVLVQSGTADKPGVILGSAITDIR
jgi:hypothetical protein